jgi:hypothetical protein
MKRRKGLVVVLVAVALGLVSFVASACGESKAVAQPSSSPRVPTSQLLSISDFSLARSRPAHALLHVSESQRLSIFVTADRRIASCKLWHVATADGSTVALKGVVLDGGSPHTNGGPEVSYWFGSPSLDPGYYRLDVAGRGHISYLVVQRAW